MRKAIAAALLMMLTGSISAPVTCAGWEGSAANRLACCKRAQHVACHEQATADDCCAGQEQSRQPAFTIAPQSATPPLQVVAVCVPAFDAVRVELTLAALCRQNLARQLHVPPNLSPPPLRI